jgi:uncharacterized protein YjbI with pentapeptide repeats
MPDSPTAEKESDFVCAREGWFRAACRGERFYREHEGKRYCVLHFPGKDKSVDFAEALQRKLAAMDFNFRGVWFPDVFLLPYSDVEADLDFSQAVFDARVEFADTIFRGTARFAETIFRNEATFDRASFGTADFAAASFEKKLNFLGVNCFGEMNFAAATFKEAANFTNASFRKKANFGRAAFNAMTKFEEATFSENSDFGGAAFQDEVNFSRATLSSADFRAVRFINGADFSDARFGNSNFADAKFAADVHFDDAKFNALSSFERATFTGIADFFHVTFNATVDFSATTFSGDANFSEAIFSSEADFEAASFKNQIDFSHAVFAGYVKFAGDEDRPAFNIQSSLNLQFARIEKPDRVSFHALVLRPHWLVYVDTRQFDFFDVRWRFVFEDEIKHLDAKKIRSPYVRLTEIFRDLATNCEDNHRYELASEFRYWAMDARRRLNRRGFAFWKLDWWYWLASGYGEKILRALFVLTFLWFAAAVLYTRVGFSSQPGDKGEVAVARRSDVASPLELPRALTYSLAVMTLQKPEPRPATTAAQTIVLFETVLGPVQAALLALAIRRKFMR